MNSVSVPALFIYYENALAEGGGGVQICSWEYFKVLTEAGFLLTPLQILNDRRLLTRIRRKVFARSYSYAFDVNKGMEKITTSLEAPTRFIFLNQSILRPLAKPLKTFLEKSQRPCQIILLSHGPKSIDYLYELRTNGSLSNVSESKTFMLGRHLVQEILQAAYIDRILCLTPFEIFFEQWLGASKVTYLPRVVDQFSPLEWKPVYGRLGFVGRLDHPPNREGLLRFFQALKKIIYGSVHVRLVGSPKEEGMKMAKFFPFVQYLGRLNDNELRREAETWNCFVHPLFGYSMGCSTKLATAISWQIPIITTKVGHRGYQWREGSLPVADDPESLARLALEVTNPKIASNVRHEIDKIKNSSPTLREIATQLRTVLSLPQ